MSNLARRVSPARSAAAALIWTFISAAIAGALTIDDFSGLDGWEELTFPKIDTTSVYDVAPGSNGSLLRLRSEGGASMLVYAHSFITAETPIVEWRWRVVKQVSGADYRSREGDDAAARLYVAFRQSINSMRPLQRAWARTQQRLYGRVPPDSALSYIWAETGDEGSFISSAYTDQSALVLVDVGSRHLGEWRDHRRNVADDYRAAFGTEPPDEFFLAIMTDSDNTQTSTEAFVDAVSILPE